MLIHVLFIIIGIFGIIELYICLVKKKIYEFIIERRDISV